MKLDVKAFGLSLGIVWAAAILILGLLAAYSGYGIKFVSAMGSLYIGYRPTLTGSIVGAIWGFVDAAIAGVIFAWLYNKLSK